MEHTKKANKIYLKYLALPVAIFEDCSAPFSGGEYSDFISLLCREASLQGENERNETKKVNPFSQTQ
jgi:hypothetical protein